MDISVQWTLLLKSGGCPAAETLHRSLRAAGLPVAVLASAYDVPAAMLQRGPAVDRLVLGVDAFGREEFAVIPMVRREWPHVSIVAYVSAGFEYKGRIAELVGAQTVLASPAQVAAYVDAVADGPALPREAAPPPPIVRADDAAPAGLFCAAPPEASPLNVTAAAPDAPHSHDDAPAPDAEAPLPGPFAPPPARERSPASAAADWDAADAQADEFADESELVDAEVIGTVELTEQELRMLLGEDDEA
jgi:hypothetical protein